jgi:AcrR family transcriptional regulator
MGRWEPDAAGRLREAALELFRERGYDQTTVADIAEAAGVTSRTFFRYYADKREVLFGGSDHLRELAMAAVAAAPAAATSLDVTRVALGALAEALGGTREWSRRRQVVVVANPELLERELAKLATLALVIADGLRDRGVPDIEATLAGETAMVVLRVAFDRWVSGPGDDSLPSLVNSSLDQLRSLIEG